MKKCNIGSLVTTIIGVLVLCIALPATTFAAGPAPVNLFSAGNFAILSETGITNTGSHTSAIVGNIGASPITAAAMNTVFCSEIRGTIYGVNAAYVGSGSQTCFAGNPPVTNKTLVDNAVLDLGIAYANAAGRVNPTATELGAGNIGGMTLTPGLYKWSTSVSIPTNVTLSGGANDVWIFQIAGNLSIASAGSVPAGIKVVLAGGAKASNIFWQVGGGTGATLGTYSTFNGNILSAKQVIMQTGAVVNGRALAQTQVTLDANTVSFPAATVAKLGSISGMKFNDANGNRIKDSREVGLWGWRINLMKIGSPAVVASTITDNSGRYSFTNLAAGTYQVREIQQTGWVQTTSNPLFVQVGAGTVSSNNNFGNHFGSLSRKN